MPGSYISPSETPQAPCSKLSSSRASIRSISNGASAPLSYPATLARAEQWPTREAMLSGVFWSIASNSAPAEGYSPVSSRIWNNPAPILSL